ncbi:GNAT family N-acetyltransferase [Actinoplanes sp. NPDC049596]|uniref:GNAT family N-acetyltransferase n=1 Tax=unclassified Actinoplanes TaxID=2626549 RepID=UPI00344794AA
MAGHERRPAPGLAPDAQGGHAVPAPLTLRPLTPADAPTIASWAGDPVFVAGAGWTPTLSPAAHVAFQLNLITNPPPELIRLGAVENGDLVGYVDLHGTEPARRELGYVIGDSRRWGRGLGGAAARAGLTHGFGELGLTHIWAEAEPTNTASIRILRSLGMTELEPDPHRRFEISFEAWRVRSSGHGEGLSGCGYGG